MRKINVWLVLLILFLSMIPANADPVEDQGKIKVIYINNDGSVSTLYSAGSEDAIVKKYVSIADFIQMNTSNVNNYADLDLTVYDVVILEHLAVEVMGALSERLTNANTSGTTIISMTQTSAEFENMADTTDVKVETVKKYLKYPLESNYKNFFLSLAVYEGVAVAEKPAAPLETDIYGIYHPDSSKIFSNASEYIEWYASERDGGHVYNPDMPTIGVIPSSVMNKIDRDSPLWDAFVRSVEDKGYNVIVGTFVYNATLYIDENANRENFMIGDEVIVDSLIAISRSGRLFATSSDLGQRELESLGVPVLNAVQLYNVMTIEDWRASDYGVSPSELQQLALAEQDGMIEPIVVAVKDDGVNNTPIPEQIEWMTERAIGWANLANKENKDKKIVIPFYAAEAGKSNVGSDPDYYLNAPESIWNLLKAMEDAGYDVGEMPKTSDELKEMMVEYGYNVGTWAPGELEKRVKKGNVVLLPVEEYAAYFETLPAEKQQEVEDEKMWGKAPGNIMIYEKDGKQYFVIPALQFGNVLLTPQPLRGRDQSETALNHTGNYPPTHQALAVYYYINDVYKADVLLPVWSNLAVMPGKQTTLAADDWTALMIRDMPHIHMLPMDASGITDKRRANMLVIDFLTPYLLPSGLYGELQEVETLVNAYEMTGDEEVKNQNMELIKQACENLSLDTALNLDWEKKEETIGKIKSHLSSIKRSYIPYGDHVLGVPPAQTQVYEMTSAMLSYNTFEVKTNGADLLIDLDELLEGKYGSSAESTKAELLDEIFAGATPAEAVTTVLSDRDPHIEYALAMALIYKLGVENEKPTENQAFAIADHLLSFDISIQTGSSAFKYRNVDDELYNIYGAEEAAVKKRELIENVIINGGDPKENIKNIFGEEVYATVTDTNLTYGEDIERVLTTVQDQIDKLNAPVNEIDSLLKALDAKYIPTGQTGDPIQNFEAIPTGRNPVQDDPRIIPTKAAYAVGQKLADSLVSLYKEENAGKYPEKVAFLLWAVEAARTGGANEGEIFALLGVQPRWDATGRINGTLPFELIPANELGRPRIDVVVETSGSYRDSYGKQIILINQAVKLAAEAPDSEEYPNYVKRNSDAIYEALKEEYKDNNTYTDAELRELSYARVFGPPEGEYTPGIENIAGSGREDEIDIAELYISRMSNVYGVEVGGKTLWGEQMPSLLKNNLKDVDMGVFSRSSNLYGVLDHPMVAAYFGGLAAAITASGGDADMYINALRNGEIDVQTLSEFLSTDLNSRYLNPEWIKGMMESGYAGTAHMEELFSVMGVWQMTMPDLVTDKMWNNLYETYMNDSKDTGVTEYLKGENAYAYQSMVAALLNSAYNGDWKPAEDIQKQLEKEYVEQTILNGVVCCHHTCSNLEFNSKIIEGLMSMDISKSEKQRYLNEINIALGQEFNIPTTQSGGGSGTGSAVIVDSTENNSSDMTVPAQTETPVDGSGFGQEATPAGSSAEAASQVSGYEMITKRMEDATSSVKDFIANPTVSSSSMIAIAFVVLVIGAVFYGFRRKGI